MVVRVLLVFQENVEELDLQEIVDPSASRDLLVHQDQMVSLDLLD